MKNIEAIRKEKRIKQEVIAAELGIKQSSYSSYITRESDITFSRLSHISNILGMSVIDVIAWPYHYGQTDVSGIPSQLEADGIEVRVRHYE